MQYWFPAFVECVSPGPPAVGLKQKDIIMEKYETRITAFIDILGFKDLINKSINDTKQVNTIIDILRYIKAWDNSGPNKWGIKQIIVEEDAQRIGIEKFEIERNTSCTCFSDSIVVSVLCEDGLINEKSSTLIANLAHIGAKLLQARILIRGGITIGELIHTNGGIVMGPALIEAYLLESTSAKNARVIISDALLAKLNYPIMTKHERYPYHQ